MIVEQGEAPPTAHPDAHFFVLDRIRTEYEQALRKARGSGTEFAPVRPVASNPMTRFYDDTSGGTIIVHPLTHEVADLFNVAYDTMLLMLLRFFAHTGESEPGLERLSRAALRIMTTVLRPLGDALAKMPVGNPQFPAMTAGPGFGYNRDVHLLPHRRSAWVFFAERLRDLATVATRLRTRSGVPREVEEAAAALQSLATQFAQVAGTGNAESEAVDFAAIEKQRSAAIEPELDGPYLVSNVENLVNSRGEQLQARPEMALCRCGGSPVRRFKEQTVLRRQPLVAKFRGRQELGTGLID